MREISLHLLDLMQNSIEAGAGQVALSLCLHEDGALDITLTDDGEGMAAPLKEAAGDPFVTSRQTRRVGLGIPLSRANAERTGGWLRVDSAPHQGCRLQIRFETRHLDCPPLGALDESLLSLIIMNPGRPDFRLTTDYMDRHGDFDTAALREVLGPEVRLNEPEVIAFISHTLREQLRSTWGGILD